MKNLLLILLSILIIGCNVRNDVKYTIKVTYLNEKIDTINIFSYKGCSIHLSQDPELHNLWVGGNKVTTGVKSFSIIEINHYK
jgi:hypothetical protein